MLIMHALIATDGTRSYTHMIFLCHDWFSAAHGVSETEI